MNTTTPDPEISVLIPMYNEEENVVRTVTAVRQMLEEAGRPWEIVLVDDGSRDRTVALAKEQATQDPRVRVLGYAQNGGQGKAIRWGLRHVRGEIIATVDADLSYGPKDLLQVIEALLAHPEVDIVVGSPYMRGGSVQDVPLARLLLSRVANRLLGAAFKGALHTTTGILRAYRREALAVLWLESNGPEINMEILSKALTLGYHVREVPAVLRGRALGRSKLRFSQTTRTYLLFSLFERPIMLFGLLGTTMLVFGGAVMVYLLGDFFRGVLNPERPLMTVLVLLVLVGLQFFSFAFLGSQLVQLRREVYRVQGRIGQWPTGDGREP